MERFYSWRDLNHCTDQGTVEALVICYNACVLAIDNVYRDIEEALKSCDNLPDCVYVIGSTSQCAVFKEAWNPDSNRRENMLMRGMKLGLDFVKQYVFLEWQKTHFVKHVLGLTEELYKFDPKRLLTWGVYSLLDKNNAIHQAPSGHAFKHPSGNKNKVFIQAREIASDEAELFVVGYTIALEHGAKLREAKKVFIDTMGIYAYVMNALDLCGGHAEILSFHSYDELEKLNPPSTPYFCIVSASTSGRMARVMKERRFEEDRIVTMVDVKSAGRCGDVMVPLDAMGVHFPDLAVSEGTLIEIIGENFTSKAKPPRPVVIGEPHAPDALNAIHKYFGFSVQPFNSTMEGGRTKLLQLNALPILEHDDFVKWLDAEINWSFPLTVSHVIHANDETSRHLAEAILGRLQSKLAKGGAIRLIPYRDLDKPICEDATGVVVISAVSRDGGILREISRDLRSYIDAPVPRHFITPIGIPQTSASWKQLEIFLTKNPTPRSYGFSNWIQMPIGDDSEQNVWTRLAELASLAQGPELNDIGLNIEASVVAESLELAANEIGEAHNSFLKSPRGKPLTLSEGYLFFAKDSEIAKRYADVSQSALYLTTSAVLQSAREHKDHTRRLCPTGYESVVLGPECFMRFNDAVLQACLLRASLPSELDYSASPELSKLMRELLSKIFTRRDKDFGDSALEFAASIAVGYLRLTRSDMNALFDECFKKATEPSALLGLLILAKHKQI
ncbi:hypothetical protein SAMN04244579_04708 [Azotobacter beijerinckii]|uniref:Uncharacterized protein n=1 Tax=Azotobacter beijerinckii TaxID=170623 RepID=A0A1H6ZNG2_9GAMM|nr:hypothetical protein [Azotobacter beijerinckii]SEJ53097.1 hypothetical protein SAMN04244579_04708 [Azotobacter beijerinckii]